MKQLFALSALFIVLLLSGCGADSTAQPAPTPQPVAVTRGTITTTVSSSGRLQPLRSAQLSLAGGEVAELFVAEGDEVVEGQPLVRLKSDTLARNVTLAQEALALQQANLDALEAGPTDLQQRAAQANLDSAQLALDNVEVNLTEEQASNNSQVLAARAQVAQAQLALDQLTASETQLETASSQVKQAELQLEAAQANLDAATVSAPFAGRVLALLVEVGEQAAGPVIQLADDSQFELVLSVDEVDMASVEVGQMAKVRMDAWPTQSIDAEIVGIALTANPSATNGLATYAVVLRLGENDLPLRNGMNGTAQITTATKDDALLLPNNAVQMNRETGSATVLLWGDGETAESQIETGLRNSSQTEVLSGLSEGDRVMPSSYSAASEEQQRGFFGGRPE